MNLVVFFGLVGLFFKTVFGLYLNFHALESENFENDIYMLPRFSDSKFATSNIFKNNENRGW